MQGSRCVTSVSEIDYFAIIVCKDWYESPISSVW